MLVLTVYAPLQIRQQAVERRKYAEALAEVTHQLDMQEPVLLVGDFNGSICPERDFMGESGARRGCCGLLGRLLGPGAAWVDVQVALQGAGALDWTFQLLDQEGRVSASRIDLVLANHVALGLIQRVEVLGDIRDGGHSPVVVELQLAGAVAIEWRAPQPRPPELLLLPSEQLRSSEAWAALVGRWLALPEVQALDVAAGWTVETLSSALRAALDSLVSLAGGWRCRGPHRRAAYDSNAIRQQRRRIMALNRVELLTRSPVGTGVGCWPRALIAAVDALRACGVSVPWGPVGELRGVVLQDLSLARAELRRLETAMRRERRDRWKGALPSLWREKPGVVHHWLQAPSVAWGTFPVLDGQGMQCVTASEVDQAVRGFWVDGVLRRAAGVDGQARWVQFMESEFAEFIPRVQWPYRPWTADRVREAVGAMRESAAPGLPGVPLGVWKALPDVWAGAIARLFNMAEEEGCWPDAWAEAYVVMIPKSAGGTRPQDQRPITVLPLLWRLWGKGVARDWVGVLQGAFLGEAAMGFRAQTGTLHVAQLLTDLIALQRRRGHELWLIGVDFFKCYEMIRWWAIFGTNSVSGGHPGPWSLCSRISTGSCAGAFGTGKWMGHGGEQRMGCLRGARLPLTS